VLYESSEKHIVFHTMGRIEHEHGSTDEADAGIGSQPADAPGPAAWRVRVA
jgi:hypothetical protein